MDELYIQNLRYKLQKRVRKLNSTGFEVFHNLLKQFWGFLTNYEIFVGILDDLEHRCQTAKEDADKIVDDQESLLGENELESAAISYFVIKKCVESDNLHIEHTIGRRYGVGTRQHDEALEYFKDIFLETLYEYIDEHLDDQRAILALLRRYKQKCEWFQRDKLLKIWENDTRRGEKNLALHLYEYLHDQGLQLMIEPWSISGEVDLIAAQDTDDPLIADAKVFTAEKGKSDVARWFNQIYIYTCDYNKPFGYLIIFKTCERDLRLALTNQTQPTPFAIYNNKTVFLLTIDICLHGESASKRDVLKTIEITEDDLFCLLDS